MLYFKTDDNRNHVHVVLVNEENGKVYFSEEDEHKHNPELTPQSEEMELDQDSMVLIKGSMYNMAFDPDTEPHSHSLEPLKPSKMKWTLGDDEEWTQQYEKYQDADELEKDSIESGVESEGFVIGGNMQWDQKVIEKRVTMGKPVLSMNVTQPMIDTLMGMFLQSETDFKAYPSEEGDELIASVITRLLKHITNTTNLQYQSMKVFKDGIIAGRGCFMPYIDYSENIKGDIKVQWVDWKTFRFGPHKEEDLSDCPYIFIQKWITEQEAKDYFDLSDDELSISTSILDSNTNHVFQDGGSLDPNSEISIGTNNSGEPGLNISLKDGNKYLVLERRDRVMKSIPVALLGDEILELGNYKKYLKQIRTIEGIKVVNKRIERIKIIVSVGSKIVSKELLSEQFSDMFVSPYYVHKFVRENKNIFYGKVEQSKLPQQEINLRHCQLSQNVAGSSSNKYFYDTKTFVNDNDRQRFIRNAHRPNGVYRVSDVNNRPLLDTGAPAPIGASQMLETDIRLFRQITNVNPEMLGTGGSDSAQSGVAIMQKKQSAMIGNEIIFSNFNMCKKKLGNQIIKLMQEVYADDPERIMRILENTYAKSKFKMPVNGQEQDFKNIPVEYIMEQLKDVDLLKYDIAIDLSQSSQSAMMQNYLLLSELAGKGLPIPVELLIKNLPIPEKDEILMGIEAEKQAQAQQLQMAEQAKAKPGQGPQGGKTPTTKNQKPKQVMHGNPSTNMSTR